MLANAIMLKLNVGFFGSISDYQGLNLAPKHHHQPNAIFKKLWPLELGLVMSGKDIYSLPTILTSDKNIIEKNHFRLIFVLHFLICCFRKVQH